uniref:Uncharacterized protein n=1 Tax=Cacopsylla melanoneura TaxID=428564 RepID=A0A8D9ED52_9HEMI
MPGDTELRAVNPFYRPLTLSSPDIGSLWTIPPIATHCPHETDWAPTTSKQWCQIIAPAGFRTRVSRVQDKYRQLFISPIGDNYLDLTKMFRNIKRSCFI